MSANQQDTSDFMLISDLISLAALRVARIKPVA